MADDELSKFASNIEDIINVLTEEEILSLATTISSGLLKNKISSRQDALKVILNYSEDITSILRRKVFTREKLLSYLYDKNISVKLPITKPEIIEKILESWTNENSLNEPSELPDRIDPHTAGCSQPTSDEMGVVQNQKIINTTSDSAFIIEKSGQLYDVNVEKTVKLLAEQFSDWFYRLLNGNELTPEHFYPDGVLNLAVVINGDTSTKNICSDPKAITETLISTKNQYNLFFNPNLMADSLKVQMDAHGLVMVIVGGTLHINSVCVGVFEQMFALARDPFAENNWKIKRTDLNLTNGTNRLEGNKNVDFYCEKALE
ncbi:uncharacterized protein C3orf38 homolog [Coccinella septempunctata]|uniref:uncharacterized protein C3orf38 homolog n=1 Tax=Coccinella septempunctata TaxID=41139 RepID=UPI001D0936F0|nr:uncharacterized protein C3orf38 homolog [Coccinella septempunctata]